MRLSVLLRMQPIKMNCLRNLIFTKMYIAYEPVEIHRLFVFIEDFRRKSLICSGISPIPIFARNDYGAVGQNLHFRY